MMKSHTSGSCLSHKIECITVVVYNIPTHSCRARASLALNFNVSPLAVPMVNVRESSSLGHTTAPARCSCHRGVLPLKFGGVAPSALFSQM